MIQQANNQEHHPEEMSGETVTFSFFSTSYSYPSCPTEHFEQNRSFKTHFHTLLHRRITPARADILIYTAGRTFHRVKGTLFDWEALCPVPSVQHPVKGKKMLLTGMAEWVDVLEHDGDGAGQ